MIGDAVWIADDDIETLRDFIDKYTDSPDHDRENNKIYMGGYPTISAVVLVAQRVVQNWDDDRTKA